MSASSLRQHPLAAALRDGLHDRRDAVLQAPTGAGKSTLVPLALLEELPADARILMLEPRRLAARAVAARMADLLGERVGQTVGYRMRLDTRVSRATRIEVITEGILARLLQEDPALEGTAWVIFDEYHERSLQADLGLALALDARATLGAGFRILIMSATIEGTRVAGLLGEAASVNVPGRAYPVQIHYLGHGLPLLPGEDPAARAAAARLGAGAASLERLCVRAVQRALQETRGDVLVFLPGVGEIRRVEQGLRDAALPPPVQVHALYGEMNAEAQDAALAAAPEGGRKIVLATNIAETSLTIPGVTAVVDSGLARRARFDPATGMSRLELVRIARSAAEQRSGRAGRTAPGIGYRLWSESAQASLAPETPPEILQADLAPLALELARWGAREANALRWLDAPPMASWQQARELLRRLDALDDAGRLTELGRQMAQLPVHPRLARMLAGAAALRAVPLAATLAALLSERDLLRGGAERDPDIRTRLDLLRGAGGTGPMPRWALDRVQRAARAIEAAVASAGFGEAPRSAAPMPEVPAGALLALAYPDRVGCGRGTDGGYLLAGGRGARFAVPTSLTRAELIVAVELDDRQREARIDLAAPLERAWLEKLFAPDIRTEESCGWDAREAALIARRVRRFGALVLEQHLLPAPDPEQAARGMIEVLQARGIDNLPWDEAARTVQARCEFVRRLGRGELADWPASDDAALLATLPEWLGSSLYGITRLDQLPRLPLAQALLARLSPAQRRALDALAPRTLTVPSGSSVAIDYLDANAPCVEVRLQEVFGLARTPHIGGGAVPVTFKLLSPARRPVQITRDLAGFWHGSYAEVRKDMRSRYPKHHWPDNPWEAAPSRDTRRPRG